MGVLRALRYPAFSWLFGGQTVSRLGDSFYALALAWWVVDTTGSAAAMGAVLIVGAIPQILLSLLGGVVGDRFSRVGLMLSSDLLRGILVCVVAVLGFSHQLHLWEIVVAAGLFGSVDAFFYPASFAVIPDILPPEALPSANSLGSMANLLTGIGGPAIGALIISLGGTSLAFALDASSFFVSGACLVVIARQPALGKPLARATGVWQDLKEGLRAVAGTPWLWITLVVSAVINITLAGPFFTTLPLLVRHDLHAGVGGLGLLNAIRAVGSVLVALYLGRLTRIRRRGLAYYAVAFVASFMLVLMGLHFPFVAVAGVVFVLSMALSAAGLIWTNTVQELIPKEMMGRVAGISLLAYIGLQPMGYALSGIAADRYGASFAFAAGGAISSCTVLIGILSSHVRALD